MTKMIDFILSNLGHTGPIIVSAALALIITLERAFALSFYYPMKNLAGFMNQIKTLVMANRFRDALELCDKNASKPVTRVIREALVRANQPEDLIQDCIEILVSEASARIQVRTAYLGTIANVSTLMGLFGTIVGLIQSFEALGSASAQQRSALLASGISTAMNTTMLGLFVAIPCMVAYSYLMNKTNRLVGEIERSAARMMTLLKQRYYELDTESTNSNSGRSIA